MIKKKRREEKGLPPWLEGLVHLVSLSLPVYKEESL